MAGYNRSRYQYETSPRKIEPEYRSTPKKYPKKNSTIKKKILQKLIIKRDKKKKCSYHLRQKL